MIESFFKMPKSLFFDERLKDLSLDAKVLFSMMLDRFSLSEKNEWQDEEKKTYIILTINEAMGLLSAGESKVIRIFSELEKRGLIERKRQGLGRPNLVYLNLKGLKLLNKKPKGIENEKIEAPKKDGQERLKSKGNNTKINNTEFTHTDSIYPSFDGEMEEKKKELIKESVKEQIDYSVLCERLSRGELSNIVDIISDCLASKKEYYTIGGEKICAEEVKKKLKSLDHTNIEHVIDSISDSAPDVKNIRSYLISALFNSPSTIDLFYATKVRKDMARE